MSGGNDDTDLELHDQMVALRRAIRQSLTSLKTPVLQALYWGHFPSARRGLLNSTQIPFTRDEMIDDLVEPEVARYILRKMAES